MIVSQLFITVKHEMYTEHFQHLTIRGYKFLNVKSSQALGTQTDKILEKSLHISELRTLLLHLFELQTRSNSNYQ